MIAKSWRHKEHLFVILEYAFAVRKTSHVRATFSFFHFPYITHNKKIVQTKTRETLECTCSVKTDCPLIDDCTKESLTYKCTATACNLKKVYLELIEGELKKQRYYDRVNSFKNYVYTNSTTLSNYMYIHIF